MLFKIKLEEKVLKEPRIGQRAVIIERPSSHRNLEPHFFAPGTEGIIVGCRDKTEISLPYEFHSEDPIMVKHYGTRQRQFVARVDFKLID